MTGTKIMTKLVALLTLGWALSACTATDHPTTPDFQFDGHCVDCHLGMSALHTHPNYKLRCIDCHGGDDTVDATGAGLVAAADALKPGGFRDPALLKAAHVVPKAGLARFFFANGIDDDGDGQIDQPFAVDSFIKPTTLVNVGETFQPSLHGEGGGEFLDVELNRDLNYTRWLNPGDLRVATIGCGAKSRGALDGGGGSGGCHQQTVDTVRRSVMVNQTAVTNGAYYGNESSNPTFFDARGNTPDPRAGAFAYSLDYTDADAVDNCIDLSATKDGVGGRGQPHFTSACLEARAASQDPGAAAGAPGNTGINGVALPAFEIAQGSIAPAAYVTTGSTLDQSLGAGNSRYPWGGTAVADPTAERAKLAVIPNREVIPGVPDPVDLILRTFRAYYPLNYPGSTINFNFTFGTSILPDILKFKTANPYGRGHSSGCTACHGNYNYDGSRNPTQVTCGPQENIAFCTNTDGSQMADGTLVAVVDPTTKHREWDAATQDVGTINGVEQLIGRATAAQDLLVTGREQQRTYSSDHTLTTAITTDQCGLCHGFVTRINYAYQGMAEEEQRDQLSRRQPQSFTTPKGTMVQILDSWVREEQDPNAANKQENGQLGVLKIDDVSAAQDIITKAKARDAMLAAQGFIPGNGGCGQQVFSEDCNNDGELETSLTLTRTDADGTTHTITINEDLNGNGKLDLIDRLPRELSIDGRQMRYIYGGRNGSTRLMDIHFERGMACIDCHFLQDVHGDGHVYSTNWDQIEIECEDCHGAGSVANLTTSGPNGGNKLLAATDANLVPYFQQTGAGIVQRSRTVPGLQWIVPQTKDQTSALAQQGHISAHVGEPGQGSTFAGAPGVTALTAAKVECAACHSSWIHNCLGCHVNANVGDLQRLSIASDGTLSQTQHENEIWFNNTNNEGHIDFQLLALMRAPFVLGVSGSSEQGRLTTFRSSMQDMVSISDENTNTVRENISFTTFQSTDGNSGRHQVATSGVAMNQTMPHTVRPNEARGCETCHTLVDDQGRVRNEHIMAETFGLGTGALSYTGDWMIAAGTGGIELYEYKANDEIATNKKKTSSTFPGLIVSDCDRDVGGVEPVFDGTAGGIVATSQATDVILIRNFNPSPLTGTVAAPTLTDVAVMGVDVGGAGRIVLSDVSGRGNIVGGAPLTRPSIGSGAAHELILTLPDVPRSLAHLGPDISDPFVYAAVGTHGVSVIQITNAPSLGTGAFAASVVTTVPLAANRTANAVVLAGDVLYVGTQEGTIDVMDLSNPISPVNAGSISVGGIVNGLALEGFMLYAATQSGVAGVVLDDPKNPKIPSGASSAILDAATIGKNLVASQGHLYVAAGAGGVVDIDVRTPAAPVNLGNLAATIAVGQAINAVDIVVSTMPGQIWLMTLDASGDLFGLKLDNTKSVRDRCFPDPKGAGCLLDLAFYDATQSGRDPSFDPVSGKFDDSVCANAATDPFLDPSAKPFIHLARTIISGGGTRLARPAYYEQQNTLTGRRYRDSFMPGSSSISLPVMQTMRSVKVCESDQDSREPGNLGALGLATGGTCTPLATAARAQKAGSCKIPLASAAVCAAANGVTTARASR